MSEPYIPQSKLLAQLLASQRHGPVLSAGQGIANVVEDLARAYGMKTANEQDKATAKTNASDSAKLLSMVLQGARPLSTSGEDMMNGVTPIPAQTAFPGGVSSMADRLSAVMGGQAAPPQQQAQQADNPVFGAPAAVNAIQRTAAVNPEVANQMGPMALQLAEQMKPRSPRALPGMKPGDQLPTQNADGTISFQTAPGTPEAKTPPEMEVALWVNGGDVDKARQWLKDTKAPKPEKAAASEFAFDRTLGKNVPVTNEQKIAEPNRYAPPIQAPQVKLFNKAGQEIGTGDPNDPTIQDRVKSGEIRTAPPRQFSGEQSKAAGFANDAITSEANVEKLLNPVGKDGAKKDPLYDPTGYFTGWSLSNATASKGKQQYDQAKSNWGMAILRQESGGAITPEEGLAYAETFFPRVGDSKEVIAQKKAQRQEKIKGVIAASGGAYDANFGAAATAPPEGVTPEEWAGMTPDEQAHFKK